MALTSQEIEDLIQSYVNLLIIQYADKPNAKQQIEDYTRGIVNDDIFGQIQDAYNIDTAVGKQLDILGKYIGIDRNGSQQAINPLANLFSVLADDVTQNDAAFGTVDSTQFPTIDSHVLGAEPTDIITVQVLGDSSYRFILKLRIIQNAINHSDKEIDDAIIQVFEGDLIPSSADGTMTMTYIVDSESLTLAVIALQKGALPKPIGVRLVYLIVRPPTQNFFGFMVNDVIIDSIDGLMVNDVGGGRLLSNDDLVF